MPLRCTAQLRERWQPTSIIKRCRFATQIVCRALEVEGRAFHRLTGCWSHPLRMFLVQTAGVVGEPAPPALFDRYRTEL